MLQNRSALLKFYDPWPVNATTSSDNNKTTSKEAQTLSRLTDSNVAIAETVVKHLNSMGVSSMPEYTRALLKEKRFLLKLVTAILDNRQMLEEAPLDSVQSLIVDLAADGKIFDNVIKQIATLVEQSTSQKLVSGSSTEKSYSPSALISVASSGLDEEANQSDCLISESIDQESRLFLLELLNLLLVSVSTILPRSRALASPWMAFLAKTTARLDDLSPQIQSLLLMISLAILGPGQLIENNTDDLDFFNAICDILDSKPFETCSKTSSILLLWASIVRESQGAEDGPQLDYSTEDLAQQAVDLGAISTFSKAYRSLRGSIYVSNVGTDFLLTTLPYLNITESMGELIYDILSPYNEMCDKFFSDPVGQRALTLTKAKAPALIGPFIWLARAFYQTERLEGNQDLVANMTTYMCELPSSFRQFEFPELEKQWHIELTGPLQVLPARKPTPSARQGQDFGEICLGVGTRGDIVTQRGPTVVMWYMEYNGWQLMGRILENAHLSRSWDATCSSIVHLVAKTLQSERKDDMFKADLISWLSASVADDTDCIEIILSQTSAALESGDENMIIAGIEFLIGLNMVKRQRVWAYIGSGYGTGSHRESLLTIANDTFLSMLASTCHDKRMINQALARLATALVEDCLLGTTFDKSNSDVSVKVTSNVLAELVGYLIAVYESCSQWTDETSEETLALCSSILAVLVLIMHSILRVKHHRDSYQYMVLESAMNTISERYLGPDCTASIAPLLTVLERAGSLRKSSHISSDHELHYVNALLIFCQLLVNARSRLGLDCSRLEEQLLFQCRNLTGCFVRYVALHRSVLSLLEALVSASWKGEQPSLLAYLGNEYSEMLTAAVAHTLESRCGTKSTIKGICSWFNAVMASKQEGLYIMLVEGSNKNDQENSLLNTIVKAATIHESKLSPSINEALLSTIALAYGSWLTSASSSKFNAALYRKLCDNINKAVLCKKSLESEPSSSFESMDRQNKIAKDSYTISICAHALRILAVQLYKSPQDKELVRLLQETFSNQADTGLHISNLSSFLTVQGYLPLLHGSLVDKMQAAGLQPDQYIAYPEPRRRYGAAFYYDLELLRIVLQFNHSDLDVSLETLVSQANLNLSIVDAQMSLIDAWCGFLTTLQESHSPLLSEANFSPVHLILPALQVTKDELGTPLFDKPNCDRLDMAFCYMLSNQASTKNIVDGRDPLADPRLLNMLVMILTSQPLNVVDAMTLASPSHQTSYYIARKVFRLVDLQLDHENSFRQTVDDALSIICIRGLRSLISSLAPNGVDRTSDFLQINNILRKCLNLARKQEFAAGSMSMDSDEIFQLNSISHLSTVITEVGCDRAVLGLFANALDLDNAPAYAELSLMYIIEWLSVRSVAERFISQGLLGMIMESKLCVSIQDVVTARSDPQLYELWAKGILTIILMLLRQFKSRVVTDIVILLKPYYNQIQNSLRSWDTDGVLISLTSIEEAFQLFLIFDILKQLSQSQYHSALPAFSKSVVADCVDYLLSHQKLLQARIFVPRAVNVQSVLPTVVEALRDLHDYLHT